MVYQVGNLTLRKIVLTATWELLAINLQLFGSQTILKNNTAFLLIASCIIKFASLHKC